MSLLSRLGSVARSLARNPSVRRGARDLGRAAIRYVQEQRGGSRQGSGQHDGARPEPDGRGQAADGVLTIPMRGFAKSLNVSVAAALALRPVAERARALGEAALLDEDERARTWARWMERAENIDAGAAARANLQG